MKKELMIVSIVMVMVCVALAFGNPYSSGWMLKCPLYWMTGLQCPLCGMQRMIHELLHLNILEAWRLNAGLMLCSPYIVLVLIGHLYKPSMRWKIVRWCSRDRVLFSVVGLMLVWGIIRNYLLT